VVSGTVSTGKKTKRAGSKLFEKENKRALVALPASYQDAFMGEQARQILAECAEVAWNPEDAPLGDGELSRMLRHVQGVISGWGDNGLSVVLALRV